MLDTKPVYGDASQLACSSVFVRFKETKIPGMLHNLGDSIGAHLILFNFSPMDSCYTLTYINERGMVLKRIAYSRESVLEVTLDRSVCRVTSIPPKTTLTPV